MRVLLLMVVGVIGVSLSAPIAAGIAVPALAVAFWRNALGTAFVAPRLRRDELAEWRGMLLSGFALAVHFAAWIPSLRLTSVASSTALFSLQVAWVVLWEFATGRRYPKAAVVGMVIALAGVLIVSGVDLTVSAEAIAGDGLALVGGMAAAAYMVIGARVRQNTGNPTYSFVVFGSCALILLVVCLVSGQDLAGYDAKAWLLLLALTIAAQLLGHSVFNSLLKEVSPTKIGLVMLLEVPGASLLAAIFLSQTPPLATFVGLGVILVGMAIVIRVTNPTRDDMSAMSGR